MKILVNKNKYTILLTMLIQTLVIVTFTLLILNSVVLNKIKNNIIYCYILLMIATMTTIFMFISMKKLSYYEKKEIELKLMKGNMGNIEELIKLINMQKHEYLTHIQTISALTYLEEYGELSSYLKGISKEYRLTSEIVRLGHPALTAIVNTKREIAREKGILFHIRCKNKINNIGINSWDLCNLLANIIENAIEAASISESKKWIKLLIDYHDENLIFEIENKGCIEKDIMKNLFKPGITSKDSPGRGYGLYISKKIVDKHRGTIDVKNTDRETVVCTIRLPRGEGNYNYDKKTV